MLKTQTKSNQTISFQILMRGHNKRCLIPSAFYILGCLRRQVINIPINTILPGFGLVGLGWVGFDGISTVVGYLMPNPLYIYILNIYDLVWLAFMAYQLL